MLETLICAGYNFILGLHRTFFMFENVLGVAMLTKSGLPERKLQLALSGFHPGILSIYFYFPVYLHKSKASEQKLYRRSDHRHPLMHARMGPFSF